MLIMIYLLILWYIMCIYIYAYSHYSQSVPRFLRLGELIKSSRLFQDAMEENRSWKHGGIPQKIKAHEYLKSSDVIRNCGLSSWSHDIWWFLRPFLAQASQFHMCMFFFRQWWRNAGASFWRNWATSWTCRQQDSKIWSFRTVNCWILDQNMEVAGERIKPAEKLVKQLSNFHR